MIDIDKIAKHVKDGEAVVIWRGEALMGRGGYTLQINKYEVINVVNFFSTSATGPAARLNIKAVDYQGNTICFNKEDFPDLYMDYPHCIAATAQYLIQHDTNLKGVPDIPSFATRKKGENGSWRIKNTPGETKPESNTTVS